MPRPHLPLNALRAFEAAARHQNLTRAAEELCVGQAALSHQIKALEARLGVTLFHRLARGVALTDEGRALYPVLNDSLDRISATLDRFADGRYRDVLSVGVVGTFAVGWLLPRLADFHAAHPRVELRVSTHNNRVDLAGEGLDAAIRFGDGDWQWQHATPILDAPLAALCAPALAQRLHAPEDLRTLPLLRSFRDSEWAAWCAAAGIAPLHARGPMFDSSLTIAAAAISGAGVALLPLRLFAHDVDAGRLECPFELRIDAGRYWLTRQRSRSDSQALQQFRAWLQACAQD